jgi:PadR family transcriptional regulator, regulatory protein PadR
MPREHYSGHLDMLLLAALRARPLHGYAIIDQVRRASGNRFDYPEGTVYPALHRLEDGGLLRSRWGDVDGRHRRVYELTTRGRKALDKHRSEWDRFAAGVRAVLEQS